MNRKLRIGRRNFLKQTAAGFMGAGLAAKGGWTQESQENKEDLRPPIKIKEYRILGRTGFRISDIGAGSILDEGVLAFALDAGVNYIDTAEQYPGHHRTIAKALKEQNRKSIFISTKLEIKEDKSKEGFLKMDQGERVLDVCREKKIGTALMKTTPIAIYYNLKSRVEQLEKEGKKVHPLYSEGLKRYKDKVDKAEDFIKAHNLQNPEEIREAAVRFCLENPNVNTVTCLAKTYDEMEGFIRLSGTRLSDWEREKLAAYREGCGELYCRHACGVCEPACPHGVPVNTILRYHHYFAAQGREREAMGLYAGIPGNRAEGCSGCAGLCESACPYHVPVQGMLLLAHKNLCLP